MSRLHVDLALARKYSVPGPRYTSYPPATHFTDGVSPEQIQEDIRANNTGARDLSLYFHLPFCYSLCWFCGCTTVITKDQSRSALYLDRLRQEMDLMRPRLDPRRRVVQLHFGGGTPTFSSPDQLRQLGQWIHERFAVAPEVEAGVETDPRRLTCDHVAALREIGFNRASMGVQDNEPRVQRAIHREQPFALTARVVDWLRSAGFTSINLDLVYGLPYQTPATFERTIDEVLTLGPDRFAVFSYAHVPWIKRSQRIYKDDVLPSAETKLALLKLTIEKLTSAGYTYIGMDHFARENDELTQAQRRKSLQRNFQGYSTRGGADIYAFGMSSISQAEHTYWQNLKDLPAYYAAVEAGRLPIARGYRLSDDDRVRRWTIMRLMCDLSLDYAAASRALGLDFPSYFGRELAGLADLAADGLIERDAAGLTVTDIGRLFIRNIAMRFDAYLPKETERRYSKTI